MNVTSIKKIFHLHFTNSINAILMFVGIAFFAGLAIVIGVMLIGKPSAYISLGSIFACVASCISIGVFSAGAFCNTFVLAVKMNMSRKNAFVGTVAYTAAFAVVAAVSLTVFVRGEGNILDAFFGGSSVYVDMLGSTFTFTLIMLAILLGIAALCFVSSAMLVKYGMVSLWIIWFIFIVFSQVLTRIGKPLNAFFSTFPPFMLPLIATFAVLLALAWATYALLTVDI